MYHPASFWLLGKLALMYAGLYALCHAGVFVAALGCYVWDDLSRAPSPAEEFAWTTLCCFALLGLPGLFLHLAGYAFFPIVWGERFPEREKALEELGGKLYFRFVRLKSDPPVATKRAVDVAAEVLSRTIPNKLWEIELVSEDDLFVGAANVRELAYPRDRARGGEWSSKRRGCFSSFSLARRSAEEDLDRDPGPSRCDLLEYAVEASGAGWGDWVVHMGADSVLNQRAVDAIAFHAARESRLVALSSANTSTLPRPGSMAHSLQQLVRVLASSSISQSLTNQLVLEAMARSGSTQLRHDMLVVSGRGSKLCTVSATAHSGSSTVGYEPKPPSCGCSPCGVAWPECSVRRLDPSHSGTPSGATTDRRAMCSPLATLMSREPGETGGGGAPGGGGGGGGAPLEFVPGRGPGGSGGAPCAVADLGAGTLFAGGGGPPGGGGGGCGGGGGGGAPRGSGGTAAALGAAPNADSCCCCRCAAY